MRIAGYCLLFIYALLMIFANVKAQKNPKAYGIIAVLGLLMGVVSLILLDTFLTLSIIFLCFSLLFYHGLAVLQGLRMYHKIHINHHIVRLVLDITILCLILL